MHKLLLSPNDSLCFFYQVKKKGKRKVIGVLDIYGFEIFKVVINKNILYAQDRICLHGFVCPLILRRQRFHPFSLALKILVLLQTQLPCTD